MRLLLIIQLALANLASIALAQDVLFPYMHGLKYSEYNETVKLGLSAHVCKDEAEWYNMTTADFAKYKAIIVPDCLCNTSLNTIKFLDDTKKVWSPAMTGNMVLIGTDPSFHAKWFGLPGAYAMMKDAISHVTLGNKNGTGMYFSLSCYYQSNSSQTAVQSLSEIGNFQVRGNLSHPCLNDAHLVATSDVMTSLNDDIASNWNCSVHEVFSDYPREGSGGFNALAVAVNASGPGQQEFADGTVGIPYIIARGATPVGCGNNVTDTKFHEQCDDGKANGTPESLCSTSCKCIYGTVSPGVCRPKENNTTTTTTSQEPTFSLFTNSSTIALSTSSVPANSSSFSRPVVTVTASLPSSSVMGNLTFTNSSSTPDPTGPENSDPITVTVFPPSLSSPSLNTPPPTITVTPVPAPPPMSSPAPPNNSSSMSYGNGTTPLEPPRPPPTVTVFPSDVPSASPPGTVTVLPSTVTMRPPPPAEDPSGSMSPPRTITVEPSSPSNSGGLPSGSGPVTVTALPPSMSQSANGTASLPSSSNSSPLSSSNPISGPVTVTALPPSMSGTPLFSSVPSQAANSSSPLSSQPSGNGSVPGGNPNGPVTVTASGSGRPDSNTSPSASETSMANPGMGSSSSSPVGTASGPSTVTGPQSGIPPVTVTAQPPDQPVVSSQPPSGGGSLSDIPGSSSGSASPSSGGQVTVTAQPSAQSSVSPSSRGGSGSGGNPGSSSAQPDGPSSPSGSGSASASGPTTILPQLTVTVVPSASASGEPGNAEGPDISGNPGAVPLSSSIGQVTAINSGQYPSSTGNGDIQTASGDPISGPSSTGAGAGAGSGSDSGSASQFSSTRPPFSNQTATLTYPDGSQTTVNSGSSSVTAAPVPISESGSATMPGGSSSSAGNDNGNGSGNGSGSGSGNSGSVTGSAQAPVGTGATANPSNGGSSGAGGGSLTLGPSGAVSSGQPVGGTVSGSPISGSGSSSGSLTGTFTSGSGSPTTLPGLPSGGTGDGSGSSGEASHTGSSGSGNGTMTGGGPSSASSGAGLGGTGTGSPIYSGSGATSPFPTATPVNCDSWIGVEIIYMTEEIEVCPEGATVTTTSTTTTATMFRSICQTSATNLPCYPCIMGTPASSNHSFTVTRMSCTTATEPTVTVTIQPCSTCTTSTYTGIVPGHTPGGPCHACSHYGEPDVTLTVTVIDPGAGLPSSEVWFSALNPTTIVTRTAGPAASVSISESECPTSTLVGVGGGYPGPSVPAVSASVPETSPAIVPIHTDPPAPGSGNNEHDPAGYTYGPPPPLHDPQPSGPAPGVPGAPGAGNGGVSTGDSHGPVTTATTPTQTPDPDPVIVTNTGVPYRPTTAVGPDYGPVLAGAPGSNMKARRASAGVVLGLLGYVVMVLLG